MGFCCPPIGRLAFPGSHTLLSAEWLTDSLERNPRSLRGVVVVCFQEVYNGGVKLFVSVRVSYLVARTGTHTRPVTLFAIVVRE